MLVLSGSSVHFHNPVTHLKNAYAAQTINLDERISQLEEKVSKDEAQLVRDYLELSDLYLKRGDSSGVEDALKRCVRLAPNHWGCNNNLGAVYIASRKFDEAEKILLKALELDEGMRHYTYYNLANLYFKQDDFNKSVEYSLYSIQHKPNFVLPHLTMGGSYYRLGEFEKARASFNRTLAIEPSNEEAKNFLNKLDKEKRLPNQKTD